MEKTSQSNIKSGTPEVITLLKDQRLSDVINSLPSGIIDKQYPGIGATTLELQDSTRSSIIVFPTRALAASKAASALNSGIKFHYLGSRFQNIKPSEHDDILQDIKDGVCIKIAVVADSLINLFEKMGNELLQNDFFIMLDEIDSFQTESNYRPKLEECIDIYLEFPPERRCLISATLEQFTDKRLRQEKKTIVDISDYRNTKLRLVNAKKSVIKVAADIIEEAASSGEKVFIGFNSIEGIIKILNLLPQKLARQSGILCSENSKVRISPYPASEIIDGILKHRITFFTSAFFVGLDILEPNDSVHVIIVTDTALPVSLLSEAKIKQILGRIRNKTSKNTLILTCSETLSNIDRQIAQVNDLRCAYESVLKNIYTSFNKLGLTNHVGVLENALLVNCRYDDVYILRRTGGNVGISSYNIDHLILKYRSYKLYVRFHNTERKLRKSFEINQITIHSDLNDDERARLAKVTALINDSKLVNKEYIIENKVTEASFGICKINKLFTSAWKYASDQIDHDKLKSILRDLPDEEKHINKVLFQIKVFSEPVSSELWNLMNVYFNLNQQYTSEYIYRSIQKLSHALQEKSPFTQCNTQNKAVAYFNLIYETKRGSKYKENRELLIKASHRNKFCKNES